MNPTEKRQKRKKKRPISAHVEQKIDKTEEEETISTATESTKLIETPTEIETEGAKLGEILSFCSDYSKYSNFSLFIR